MRRQLNVVELFSGIGAQMKALRNIGYKVNTIATCDWWCYAVLAYALIHEDKNILKKNNFDRQKLVDLLYNKGITINGKNRATKNAIKQMNEEILNYIYNSYEKTNNLCDVRAINGVLLGDNIDLMTYSFPCQDLSTAGCLSSKNSGLDPQKNTRSSLLWEVGRILSEMKESNSRLPKYLLMENVPNILSNKHKPLFNVWIKNLEDLGYINKYFLLEATDFGLPQTRKRCFMLSIRVQERERERERDCAFVQDFLQELTEQKIISDYKNSPYYKDRKITDLLRNNTQEDSILYAEESETLMNATPTRLRMIDNCTKLVDENLNVTSRKGVHTITTGQDKYPNSGIIYCTRNDTQKTSFRLLTPRECFLFQGFDDNDFEKVYYNNIKRNQSSRLFSKQVAWRLAGNSIAVPVLEAIFLQIARFEELNETNSNKYDCSRHN